MGVQHETLGASCMRVYLQYSKMAGPPGKAPPRKSLGVATVPCLPPAPGKAVGVLSLNTLPAETGHFFSFFVLLFFGFGTGC